MSFPSRVGTPVPEHGISFFGSVNTAEEAMRLVVAARLHIIPRITRRLTDRERMELIVSGNVFIFDVEETGIHRWTDGRAWNDSRILGNFLVRFAQHKDAC
jgi:Gti1/Pac2 family transcription factor